MYKCKYTHIYIKMQKIQIFIIIILITLVELLKKINFNSSYTQQKRNREYMCVRYVNISLNIKNVGFYN